MLSFVYQARDPSTGNKITAEVQAADEQTAVRLIKEQGYAPIEIKLKDSVGNNPISRFRNRIPAKEKVVFTRQLATLINAGLPLVQSLRMIAEQTANKRLASIIGQMVADIEGGGKLSDSLAKHSDVFPSIYIGVVEAGETSGTLDKSLERLANQQEHDAEINSKIRGAMIYPAIVLLVMLAVVIFMIVKVLPQIETLYDGIKGAKLPFLTRSLLFFANALINYWYIFIILIGAGVFFTTKWARTGPGKLLIDKYKLRGPVLSNLFTKVYMARFTRTGTTLVGSGVPLLQTLQVASDSVGNLYIRDSILKASEKVRGGKALSESLEGDPNFLPLVPSMLKIGEQSGQLETMMAKTADYYEKEVDNQIKAISTIIEPILMILMGITALIIVAAILLPIYGLVGQNIIK